MGVRRWLRCESRLLRGDDLFGGSRESKSISVPDDELIFRVSDNAVYDSLEHPSYNLSAPLSSF